MAISSKQGVIPVLEKGDGTKFENYRPISLLRLFSNIYENVRYL